MSATARPRVLVARVLLPAGLALLEARCDVVLGGLDVRPERLRGLAAGVEALVADPTVEVDEALLDAAGPQIRVIANFAVGHDNVDLEVCRARGIAVTNTPGVLTNATSELALALTVAAARRMSDAEADLRAGAWVGWDPGAHLGTELSGATFGVVGMGRIGRRYAELIAPLAGRIVYVAQSAKPDAERDLGAVRVELPALLGEAGVVSLHVPGGPETAGLIGRAELEAMRADAVLVNTARGSLVDAAALAEALGDGRIGAAGLDVFEGEPEVPAELLAAPRCVLVPHIGSATDRARDAMARLVAENVLAVLDGEEPPSRVA
ncbi:MAG: 2-hydroxyacid dehydrogenase [Solirubrobacterales bacterium]